MDRERVAYLCAGYLNLEATRAELIEFEALLLDSEAEEFLKVALTDAYYHLPLERYKDLSPERAALIFDKIKDPITPQRIAKLKFMWSAAAAVLVIGGSLLLINKPNTQETKNTTVTHEISPGKEGATLILADGRKILLSEALEGELANESGVVISKNAAGALIYSVRNTEENKVVAKPKSSYNRLSTARGEQYQVRLPDSSLVWLNAASELKYPSSFNTLKERRVELSGEAYFEVAKNKKQPFFVLADGQEVKVLGTHFNVSSYSDEPDAITTLLEGSVQISGNGEVKVLKPGERAVRTGSQIKVSEADLSEDMAWKNGDFYFNNVGIASIMRQISRWYDVEIIYQGELTDEKFYGTISRSKNIKQVLNVLEKTKSVHFKVEGRRVLIMK